MINRTRKAFQDLRKGVHPRRVWTDFVRSGDLTDRKMRKASHNYDENMKVLYEVFGKNFDKAEPEHPFTQPIRAEHGAADVRWILKKHGEVGRQALQKHGWQALDAFTRTGDTEKAHSMLPKPEFKHDEYLSTVYNREFPHMYEKVLSEDANRKDGKPPITEEEALRVAHRITIGYMHPWLTDEMAVDTGTELVLKEDKARVELPKDKEGKEIVFDKDGKPTKRVFKIRVD